MRILHVITKADVGGAQTHVLELATGQLAAGHEVALASGVLGAMAETAAGRGVEVIAEPTLRHAPSPLADAGALRAMRGALVRAAPDVVHAHSSKAGLIVRLTARRIDLPCVYTAHGWPFQSGSPAMQRLMSRSGETLAGHWWGHVICLTEAEASLARRGRVVPAKRLHVVPNGLPDVPASRRADLGQAAHDRCRIVVVARFAPPKDQLGVVRAVATIPTAGWHLSFVGDGPGRAEVESVVASLGLAAQVEFLGDRTDVDELLAGSDVFVLWSKYEGMPLALMEAMRAGLACVANDLPGVRELLGEAADGVVPYRADALSRVLVDLVADAERRRANAQASRSRFEQRFGLTRMLTGVGEVYEIALNEA